MQRSRMLISQYGMDLMMLDGENASLSTAIQDWLAGSGGGPPPPAP